jgi:hypothetical protein
VLAESAKNETAKKAEANKAFQDTVKAYVAEIAKVDLQLSQAGVEVDLGAGKARNLFRPIAPGVVAFKPEALEILKDFYSKDNKGGNFEQIKDGLFSGKASGEETFYVPEARVEDMLLDTPTVDGLKDTAKDKPVAGKNTNLADFDQKSGEFGQKMGMKVGGEKGAIVEHVEVTARAGEAQVEAGLRVPYSRATSCGIASRRANLENPGPMRPWTPRVVGWALCTLFATGCGRLGVPQVGDAAPVTDPTEVVGCSDGEREGYLDNPTIAACKAAWIGELDLRAVPTGAACGDDLGLCAAPTDACAHGWHICARSGDVAELLVLDAAACNGGVAGRYVAASGHCASNGCTYPVPPQLFTCVSSVADYCIEPICCGDDCGITPCPDAVWPGTTRINKGPIHGCGNTPSTNQEGVLCCRDQTFGASG